MEFNPFEIAKRLEPTVEMVNNVYSHWFMESQLNMVKNWMTRSNGNSQTYELSAANTALFYVFK